MLAKKIRTTETFILPEEFEFYSQLGYVIFMTTPTRFGTYRAIKIEVIKNKNSAPDLQEVSRPIPTLFNPLNRFWNSLNTRA